MTEIQALLLIKEMCIRDRFRGLKFNIVLSIIKVNRLEVPNSHQGDQ